MKRTILSIILFIYTVSFTPQQKCPVIKVYAYAQPMLQGMSPKGPVEEGKNESTTLIKTGKSNYLFYVLIREKEILYPSVVWLKGQGFEVKVDTITRLPVKMPGSNAAGKQVEILLVPATSKTVLKLTPGTQLNFFAPPEPRLQALLDTNELVIEYRWKGETCYFPAGKIKKLEPVAAQ